MLSGKVILDLSISGMRLPRHSPGRPVYGFWDLLPVT